MDRADKSLDQEKDWIARVQSGDNEAFESLVKQHQRLVYAVALRMLGDAHEAQEIAQDAFVRAYEGLKGFRGQSKFSTWLVTITMNLCRNRRRSYARRSKHIAASLDEPIGEGQDQTLRDQIADETPGPLDQAQKREWQQLINGALQELDMDHRSVLVMRDLHGMRYEEIAAALCCPEGTVKSRINRARLQLRDILKGMGWETAG